MSTRLSLGEKNEMANAGQDSRNYIARSHSQARAATKETYLSLLSRPRGGSRVGDDTRLMVNKSDNIDIQVNKELQGLYVFLI